MTLQYFNVLHKRMSRLATMFVVAALSAAGTLHATDYYVNGTTGNDGNNGLTPATAKATIPAGVTAASPNDVVNIAAGTYTLTSTLLLNKAGLTLKGASSATTIVRTSGTANGITITASGVTIQDLTVEKTDLLDQTLIFINANNVTIKNNLIFGPAPTPSYMTTSGIVTRAMETAGSLTGLLIDNNTIHTLRQPAYINTNTVGTVSNNLVYGTKGWVLAGANITFTNNSWGSGTSGPMPANRFDIAILAGTNAAWYTDIVAISNANNIAQITDQRYSPNRLSFAYVDPSSLATPRDGSPYYPFLSAAEANPSLAPGGRIFSPDFRLPVELADFDLSSINGSVYLQWRTASEIDNAGFEVYRASQADTTFRVIASYVSNPGLAGLGTTSYGQRYSLIDGGDGSLRIGETYRYRLVDVTSDGTRNAHEPKSVMIDGASGSVNYSFFRLYPIAPNPASGDVRVSFSTADAGIVRIEVLGIDGKSVTVPVEGREYQAGEHSEVIATSELAAGNYMVRIISANRTATRTLTIVR